MAKTWSDPYPNLPRTGGIARQLGHAEGVDRLSRPAVPPSRPDREAEPELTRFRAELTLLRKELALLREGLAVLRSDLNEVTGRNAEALQGITEGVTRDAGDVTEDVTRDAPGVTETPTARRQRRYRERLRAKLREDGA
jgi:hypothetical protein